MNETGETPIPTEGPVSPEFADAMKTAIAEIQSDAQNPAHQVAKSTAELGFFAELGQVAKAHGKRELGIQWKNIKAAGLGAISLMPFVGTIGNVGEAVKAGRNVSKTSKAFKEVKDLGLLQHIVPLEDYNLAKQALKASLKQIPLSRNVVTGPWQEGRKAWEARKAVNVAQKGAMLAHESGSAFKDLNAAKEAAKFANTGLKEAVKRTAFHKAMEFVDPTPDVPGKISLIFGLGEFVLPGSNLVPAAWQMAVNSYEHVRNSGEFGKDVFGVYKRQAEKMLGRLKQPEVSRAAKVFVPSAA